MAGRIGLRLVGW